MGEPLSQLKISKLSHEEIEALRLRHIENFDQISAAEKMETSQSTFQRILATAHEKIAIALVQNQAIEIDPEF